jgi:DNA (cytosine-5)-methyltransferase 1
MSRSFRVADLFCGAGGSSTGVVQACESIGRKVDLVAVNHWDRAVETHSANHPNAGHHCEDLTTMDPRKAVPGGKLDLLVASPECTHHSVARGGKPCNDQSRASAWCVLRWATALSIDRILIENVPEFVSWGPIGSNGRPLQSRRGEIFESFVNSLKASGYRVDWRVLNSANYGAATSRRRLFLQAVKGRREIVWPDATHDQEPTPGLFGDRKRWRGAREIIDWKLLGSSIFNRKRPLSANTLARIEAGLRKFGGKNAEPFLVLLKGTQAGHLDSSAKSVNGPVPALTTGNNVGLCEPFIVTANHGADADGGGHDRRAHSLGKPLGTVVAGGKSHALCQPTMVQLTHGGRELSIDDPLPTVTTAKRGEIALVQPFIVPHRMFDRQDVDSVNDPIRTIKATGGEHSLCRPFMVPYYGACHEADSIDDPVRTVTTKDRLGIVEPQSHQRLDILFRMLQPHELAAAMGFPAGYKITGNRGEQVKQIGNAVEVNQARELAKPMVAA